MPPSEPRTSPEELQADGMELLARGETASFDQPLHEEPDPRELSEDERAASWLQAGGFEVG